MENPSTWSPLTSAINSFDHEDELLKLLIAKGFVPAEPYNDMLGVIRLAYVEFMEDFGKGVCGYSLGRRVEFKLKELLGERLDYYFP